MSVVDFGLSQGFIEEANNRTIMVVYPKRVINQDVLTQILKELSADGYEMPERLSFSQPIVAKKRDRIDFTEILVKLFSLTVSYGVNFKVTTFSSAESNNIRVSFEYNKKEIVKNFDVDMLCAMEKDYVLGWFEETLQKIDEKENEDASR